LTTATAFRLLFSLFYGQFFAFDTSAIQRLYRPFRLRIIRHIHEPEAFTFPCLSVKDNFCGMHYTIQFEHFFQINIVEIRR
jgi:hypothetical protein